MVRISQSIRTKFILAIIITVTSFLIMLLVLSYNSMKEAAIESAQELSHTILLQTDKRIDAFFEEIEKLARSLSRYSPFYESRPEEMKPLILATVETHRDYLRAIYLGTANGEMYEWGMGPGFVDNAPVFEAGYDPRERPWYREALEAGGFAISEPYLYASVRALGITGVIPVHDNGGNFVGVLGLDIMLDDLKKIIDQLNPEKTSKVILLNRDNQVIVDQFNGQGKGYEDFQLKEFTLFPVEKTETLNSGHLMRLKDLEKSYYVTSTRNRMTDWKLIVALPYDYVMASAFRNIKFIIFLDILLMALLTVVLSILSNSMIIHPLADTIEVMQKLESGEGTARVSEDRKDEFGILARQFNRLIETVNDYHRSLEDKVRKRTNELMDLQRENLRLRLIEEKERIYGYLHDSLGARLTNIFISNSVAQSALENDKATLVEMLDRIETNTKQGIADLQEILHSSEADDRRIIDFSRMIRKNITKRLELKNISFSCQIDHPERINELSRGKRFEIEKILQELTSNVLKHSFADEVKLALHVMDGTVQLVLSDNGKGGAAMEAQKEGFGLGNIKSRIGHLGGTFRIHSPAGKGTTISITIPVLSTKGEDL